LTQIFVAIDPGKNACGLSAWKGDNFNLEFAELVKNPFVKTLSKQRAQKWGDMGKEVARVLYKTFGLDNGKISLILEIPQIYEGYQEEDKNDLLDLAGVQGAIVAATGAEVAWCPTPREWKGQLKKEITQKRVDDKLSHSELNSVKWPSPSLRHNVYDAIHLGIVWLERQGLREFTKLVD